MKKNIAMRVAAILFILTMISTCAFSTTFAKYVTSDEAKDTARVAKWGVEVSVEGQDAFAETYNDKYESTGTKVVSVGAKEAATDDSVLAPGTNGTLTTVTITGTPEVMVDIIVEVDLALDKWTVDGSYYCPVVITVGSTAISGLSYTSMADFEAAVEKAVSDELKADDVAANKDLADSLTVTWEWAFETGADADAKAANNVKDTALGDAAADGTPATISFSLKVTVEQVD